MAYLRSTTFGGAAADATNATNLLQLLIRFLTGVDTWTTTAIGGVQLHYVHAKAAAVAETWTITCTNAGAGTFSVVGSVSGAAASATVGTPYDNGKIAFTLVNRTGAAVLADVFTVVTYPGTLVTQDETWQLIRHTYDGGSSSYTYYLKGLGLGGTDEIFVTLYNYQNVGSDIYNLAITGATGHLLTADGVTLQPGYSPTKHVCLWNSSLPYLFVADGRHFKFCARVSSGTYESCGGGFYLPTGLPSESPYPMWIGGSCSVSGRRYSETTGSNGSEHRAFWNPHATLAVFRKDGTWDDFGNYKFATSETTDTIHLVNPWTVFTFNRALDAGAITASSLYPLQSAILTSDSPPDVLGDLPGIYHISGFSQSPENTTVIGGVTYFILQNTFRTAANEFAAFKLE